MKSWLNAAILLTLCACTGCWSPTGEGILARHLADEPNADARKHWDGVRGDVQLNVAEQHFSAGRLDEAEKTVNTVIATSPNNCAAYELATRIFIERGQLARARKMIKRAMELPNHDGETRYLAGLVAQRYGEYDEALGHYAESARLNPGVVDYVLATAETYVTLDRQVEALQLLNKAVPHFDACGPLRMLAAQVSRMLGLKDAAVEHCRAALRDREDERWDVEAGLLFFWAGAHDDSIRLLQPLVEKAIVRGGDVVSGRLNEGGPVTPSVVRTLARAFIATGRPKQAETVLKPLLSNDSEDAAAWSLFCRAALEAGHYREASEAITKFNRHSVATAETQLLEALVHYSRGAYQAASKAASSALQLDSELEAAQWILNESRAGKQGLTQPVSMKPIACPSWEDMSGRPRPRSALADSGVEN